MASISTVTMKNMRQIGIQRKGDDQLIWTRVYLGAYHGEIIVGDYSVCYWFSSGEEEPF